MPMSSSWAWKKRPTLLGVPLTDYLTTLEYEPCGWTAAPARYSGPFDATYDLACNLHGGGRLAEQLPDYRLVLCDELHDLNEAAFRILDALINRNATSSAPATRTR
jgi:DNA helicase-2/ATP-dependent DNA helicase PcrA